ncbi:MAG: YgaP family membrane protein [Adhaeribacter sp.]
MGTTDRILRSVAAAGAFALIAGGKVKGNAALALGTMATVFLLTSSVGHCPAYTLAGVDTLP